MSPDQDTLRDAALRATLPHVGALGWSKAALRAGLADIGESEEVEAWLFPRGPVSMVEAWCGLADRDMAAEAGDLTALRIPARIRRLIEIRLTQAEPWRDAKRRGVALLSMPWNARLAACCAARTADAMWVAAGDTSADLSRHTRRLTLAAIHTATLAFWLREPPPGMEATLAFLDRRLGDLARLQRRRRAA